MCTLLSHKSGILRINPRGWIAPWFVALVFAGTLLVPDDGFALPPSGSTERLVSSEAYYHAMRAELARAKDDLSAARDALQLALVYDSGSTYLHVELAKVAMRTARPDRAAWHLERALTLNPDHVSARLLRAKLLEEQGQLSRAEAALRRAIASAPDSAVPAVSLAALWERQGRTDDAFQLLKDTLVRVPGAAEPYAAIARIEESRRRFARAAEALERARDRAPGNIRLVIDLTRIYERQGRLEDAAKSWRLFGEYNPGHFEGLLYAAQAEFAVGRDEVGDRHLELLRGRGFAPALEARIGMMLLQEGRFERSAWALKEVVRAAPSTEAHRYWLAVALSKMGRDDEALAEFEHISPKSTFYEDARLRVARILMASGRPDRAALALGTGIERSPESVAMIGELAVVEARSRRVKEALDLIRDARRQQDSPRLAAVEATILLRYAKPSKALDRVRRYLIKTAELGSEDAAFHLAQIFTEARAHDEAALVAARGLERHPESVRLLRFLTFLYAERGEQLEHAAELGLRALRLEPRSGEVMHALGFVYFRLGRFDDAERILQRAARFAPDHPSVAERLGDTRVTQGDTKGAEAAYGVSHRLYQRLERARAPGAERDVQRVKGKLLALTRPSGS